MENQELLSSMESTLAFLEDDITALGYLQDEYFAFETPKEGFEYRYKAIQNALETLFKSMMFNSQRLKEAVDKGYEVRRMQEQN